MRARCIGGSVALGLVSCAFRYRRRRSSSPRTRARARDARARLQPAPRDEAETPCARWSTNGRAGAGSPATPVLLLILAISAFYGAWSEAYDRLGEAHVIRDVGLPSFAGLSFIVWFGVISAASLLLSLLVARPANRRLEHAPRADDHARPPLRRRRAHRDGCLLGPRRRVKAPARPDARDVHDSQLRRPALLQLAHPVDCRLARPRDGLLDHGQANAIGQWTGGPPSALSGTSSAFARHSCSARFSSAGGRLYARAIRRDGGLGQPVEAGA